MLRMAGIRDAVKDRALIERLGLAAGKLAGFGHHPG
jgi:hypothetical protein